MVLRSCALEGLGMSQDLYPEFWIGKQVFVTGHTGFKGGWLCHWLASMGAKVTGYALAPNTMPNLFTVANVASSLVRSHIGDIADLERLKLAIIEAQPDVLIHLAAQPLVRYSYANPVQTYQTNVMGTVNILEAVRACSTIKAVLIVTSDKCYENQEWAWGYRESEPMGGHDPYSNSKGCAELVTAAYRQSYFPAASYNSHGVAIATARAGNVIGGGDWSQDRLIPDAIRAFEGNKPLIIRHPSAIRPWQHVLEPLSGYLVLAQALYQKGACFNGPWNFGPQESDARPVQEVIELLVQGWNNSASWLQDGGPQVHEANFLKLDCSKARQYLGWNSKWNLESAIESIVSWQLAFRGDLDMKTFTLKQIQSYLKAEKKIRFPIFI